MSSKDRPIFDNTRSGNVINYEYDYYNNLFNDSNYEEEDSDYFESYYRKMKNKNAESDSDSDSE